MKINGLVCSRRYPLLCISILLFIIYLLINVRHIVAYAILLALAGFLQYLLYRQPLRVNLGHIFFLAFIIDAHDGIAGEILFILLAGLVPEIIACYIELKIFFSYPVMIGIISITVLLSGLPFALSGIISAFIYYLLMFLISSITAEPPHERFLEVVMPFIFNVIYFANLSLPMYSLLDFII